MLHPPNRSNLFIGCLLLVWTHQQPVLPVKPPLWTLHSLPAFLPQCLGGLRLEGSCLGGHIQHSLLWELPAVLAARCFLCLTTPKSLLPPLLGWAGSCAPSVRQWFLQGLFFASSEVFNLKISECLRAGHVRASHLKQQTDTSSWAGV